MGTKSPLKVTLFIAHARYSSPVASRYSGGAKNLRCGFARHVFERQHPVACLLRLGARDVKTTQNERVQRGFSLRGWTLKPADCLSRMRGVRIGSGPKPSALDHLVRCTQPNTMGAPSSASDLTSAVSCADRIVTSCLDGLWRNERRRCWRNPQAYVPFYVC